MSSLKINILTFNHAAPVSIPFFKEQRSKNDITLKRSEIPFEIYEQLQPTEQESIKCLYTDFISQDNPDFQIEIDLTKSTRFARHYYSFLIRQYFKTKATFVTDNFVADTELWFRDESLCTAKFNTYRVYTLKVQMAKISDLPELVICDNGTSRISTSSLLEIDNVDDDIIKTVVCDDQLFKYAEHPELRANLDKVYPLINNPLAKFLGLPVSKRPTGNKYHRTYSSINQFVSNHLDNEEFKKVIPLTSLELLSVPREKTFRTKKKSSYINLGVGEKKVSVLTPKGNLKEHGPFAIPNKPVKFIAIFHKSDKDYANKLHIIFNRLYKARSGKHENDQYGTSLYDFIRVKFDLDIEKSIILENLENPHLAINDFLDQNSIDTDKYNYVAIYLSPIKKDDEDLAKQKVYYNIKKTLLFNNITSQVIHKESLNSTYFKKLYYQNIAAAILGKSGGTPWKLASEPTNELVIGLGAFRSKKFETQYIGSAFCFSNNGEFQEFNCMAKRNSDLLAQEIKLYLETYIETHGTPERIVIHYYKKMSREELEPINEMVYSLGFGDIPIIIITINKTMSKDYIVFDQDAPDDLIPFSGTIINYGRDQYLLFNNTRYEGVESKIESYHLPLKLSISSNKPAAIKDVALKKELIDQIYQFSRMYWKSVKQQNLPVTIKYPEMVAEIFPYFEIEELMPFGRSNLWFL